MLAACGGDTVGDPCAGHAGTCLGLVVTDGTYSGDVDQLRIRVAAQGIDGEQTTPVTPVERSLPVRTAVYLPKGPFDGLELDVTGMLSGDVVGTYTGTFHVDDGAHPTLTVPLDAPVAPDLTMDIADGGSDDGDMIVVTDTPDLTVPVTPPDLTMPTLPDLTTAPPPDLTTAPPPDLTTAPPPDLTMPPPDLTTAQVPRRIFVSAQAVNGGFGGLTQADAQCQNDATSAGLAGTYKALLSGAGTDAASRFQFIILSRPIELPNNTVVASEGTFWSAMHAHPINIEANGTFTASSCAWTDTDTSGKAIPGDDCQGWTSSWTNTAGDVGQPTAWQDMSWIESAATACVAMCNFYCMQTF